MSECLHPNLQLQLVVPEKCFDRGGLGGHYTCERCGAKFNTDLNPYAIKVRTGAPSAATEQGEFGR